MNMKDVGRIMEKKFTKRQMAILAAKVVAVCIFMLLYLLLFIQGIYRKKESVYWGRIILSTVIVIVPSVILFIKVKLPERINTIVSICFSIFVMIENFMMLQMSQGYHYIWYSKHIIVLNMLVIFTIFITLYAVFNSFKIAIIGLNVITVIFGLTNYFIVMFRGTAFLAVDVLNISTAANVAGEYSYTLNFPVYLLVITSVAICFLAVKLGRNTFTSGRKRVLSIALAVFIVFGCYQCFFGTDRYDKLLKIKYFKPQKTYAENGMYATFVKSIRDLIVDVPEGYSSDAVEKLAKENRGTSAAIKEEQYPNIIVIMDEAFTDFSSFTDLKINKDCLPFYHSLKENAIKGQMFVSTFGGGTASTEFEVLTSNTMAFIPNGITAYTTYINDPMSSMATILNKQNYGGLLAMHPYYGNGYKRDKVYPLLGFRDFITMDDFKMDANRVGRHISDEADVDRIITEYENHKKENDTPFYMFNVTMQNHSPFNAENVSGDIRLEYDMDIPQAQQYMNLMKHTDDALRKIVTYFEGKKEPTLIVFFGDHQPKLEKSFYSEVKKGYKLDDAYRKLLKYNTQFMIWANYDIEEQQDVYISANYLRELVLDTAGLAKTGYDEFVAKVKEEIPIITKHGYIDKNGSFYMNGDKHSPYYELLSQYNILEYNNIFDVKNRNDSLFEIK